MAGFLVKEVCALPSSSVLLLILRQALRRAYLQQSNFRQFLQALAGVVLFGTPHSTSEDTESWQSSVLLEQVGLISKSKKRKTLDPGDIEKFARFSLRFEQASVIAPILSIYETQPTKVKGPLWSVKRGPVRSLLVLFASGDRPNRKCRGWSGDSSTNRRQPSHFTGKGFVATNSRHEELMALDTDHKNLCNVDIRGVGFNMMTRFLTTVLEDARLMIARGSPTCEYVLDK